MTLFKRVLVEKRAVVLPLIIGVFVNLGVYALVVYPLGVKSAGAADRAVAAERAVTAAERDQAGARALVAGKTRAEQELTTFYGKVLPANFAAARRITYARLPALARKANVRYEQGKFETDPTFKDPRLGRLKIRMVLQGDYNDIRQFIYQLETAPEFVIIDGVTLTQAEATRPLTLTLELSTYYRLGGDGT